MKPYRLFVALLVLLSSSVAAAYTDARLYRPFSVAQGQAVLQISQTLKGDCWTHSIKDPRPDAWRCRAQQQTFDPCFVKTHVERNVVVCPQAPWSSQAVKIELAQELQENGLAELDMSISNPWSIELSDGTLCQLSHASGASNNHLAQYNCPQGARLVGEIQRCKSVWRTFLQKPGMETQRVDIKTAWY